MVELHSRASIAYLCTQIYLFCLRRHLGTRVRNIFAVRVFPEQRQCSIFLKQIVRLYCLSQRTKRLICAIVRRAAERIAPFDFSSQLVVPREHGIGSYRVGIGQRVQNIVLHLLNCEHSIRDNCILRDNQLQTACLVR